MKGVWEEYDDKATWETKLFKKKNPYIKYPCCVFLAYIRHQAEKGVEDV